MQKRKTIILLSAAILCGLIGTFFVIRYVNSVKTVYNDLPSGEVVIAAHKIPPYTRITNEMVQIATFQSEYILPQAFTKLEDIVGAMTTTEIVKGEQIIDGRISKGEYSSEFAYRIPDGKRAISVGVDDISGVAGLIRPGNRVDVIGTFEVPDDNNGSAEGEGTATDGKTTVNVKVKVSWAEELSHFHKIAQKLMEGRRMIAFDGKSITFTLFPNIEVLAVGDKVAYTKEEQEEKDKDKEEKSDKTITLCLDPAQAEILANMEEIGTLKFDLRNPGDDKTVEMKPIVEYKPK